jgi:hypothetical protein
MSACGREPDPHALTVLCERRLGRPVDAASRVRSKTRAGTRISVLALAAGYVWWLELHPWRTEIGAIVGYRPLAGLAPHTEPRRKGRHAVELSWPTSGELFVGTAYGSGAARLVGQLTADEFARTQVGSNAREDQFDWD